MVYKADNYNVVGACAGHVQRSPSMQAVLNYAKDRSGHELADRVFITSAGFRVKQIEANEVSLGSMLKVIGVVLGYGLADESELGFNYMAYKMMEQRGDSHFMNPQVVDSIRIAYAKLRPRGVELLAGYRRQALVELGVPEEYDPVSSKPFEPGENLDFVICAEKKVEKEIRSQVEGWSEGKEGVMLPEIAVYGSIVGAEPLDDVLDGGLDEAIFQVRYFIDTADRALQQIFRRAEEKFQ